MPRAGVAEHPPAPQARGRAVAIEADHGRVADLLVRRQVLLTLVAENEAELRRRGVEIDAVRPPMPAAPQADHRVSAGEAAKILGVDKRTIRRWAAASGCGYVSVTGRMVVDVPGLQEWRASPR